LENRGNDVGGFFGLAPRRRPYGVAPLRRPYYGVVAACARLIDFLSDRLVRALPKAWLHMVGNIIVMLLALFNSFVHSRDAWTSVVPTGLALSALTV
jgi:hypothetical protein